MTSEFKVKEQKCRKFKKLFSLMKFSILAVDVESRKKIFSYFKIFI